MEPDPQQRRHPSASRFSTDPTTAACDAALAACSLQPRDAPAAGCDVQSLGQALPELSSSGPTTPPPTPIMAAAPGLAPSASAESLSSSWASRPPTAAPVLDTQQIVSNMIDNIFSNVILSIETEEVVGKVGKMRLDRDGGGGRRHAPARHQPYASAHASSRQASMLARARAAGAYPPPRTTNGYY